MSKMHVLHNVKAHFVGFQREDIKQMESFN